MKTIETTMTVLPDGSIQIPPRADLTPGRHRVVLVVEEPVVTATARRPAPLQLKMLDWSAWPEGSTFRREEIYGDKDFAPYADVITVVPLEPPTPAPAAEV